VSSCKISSKSSKRFWRYLDFVYFQDSRRPPSWIVKFLNFWSTVRFGDLICIAVPNVTKIGRTVAEISHVTFFKKAAVRHLGFLKV